MVVASQIMSLSILVGCRCVCLCTDVGLGLRVALRVYVCRQKVRSYVPISASRYMHPYLSVWLSTQPYTCITGTCSLAVPGADTAFPVHPKSER